MFSAFTGLLQGCPPPPPPPPPITKRPEIWNWVVFLVLGLNKLLNKTAPVSCWWFETLWRSRGATVIVCVNFCNHLLLSHYLSTYMMTSSNGNIFRVIGHLCGNSLVTGEFPAQRPVTRSFDVFFDLRLNKRLSKQSRGWWFETPSRPLWRRCNDFPKLFSLRTLTMWLTREHTRCEVHHYCAYRCRRYPWEKH